LPAISNAASVAAAAAEPQRRKRQVKPLYATILAAGMLLTVNPVLAEESKIEMSKLTCKQFAAYDRDNMSIIMMWLEGYYTKEDEDAVIDFGKMAGDTAHLIVYCGDHPDDDIIKAADEVLGG
jgi:acid stress chaperone HdeB